MNLLVEWIKLEEGFRAEPYRNAQGVWAVGYGRNLEAHPMPGRDWILRPYTAAEADDWLREQVRVLYFSLRDHKPILEDIEAPRAAAMINMAYQLGIDGLLRFRRLWGAVEDRNWTQAATLAGESSWAAQAPHRARRVCHALLSGEWPPDIEATRC